MHKLQLRRSVFAQLDLWVVVSRAEMQFLLRAEYVIFLLLLVHLLDVDLHVLIGLDSLTYVELALQLGRYLVFRGIKNLVIQLNLVLEAVFAAVEKFDALLFVTVDGDFGLF